MEQGFFESGITNQVERQCMYDSKNADQLQVNKTRTLNGGNIRLKRCFTEGRMAGKSSKRGSVTIEKLDGVRHKHRQSRTLSRLC